MSSIRTIREWQEWHDTVTGLNRTQDRNSVKFGNALQRRVRRAQLDRRKAAEEQAKELRDNTGAAIEAHHAECADLIAGLRSGRISASVGRRQAAAVHAALPVIREWVSDGRAADDQSWAEVCTDPADFEEEQLRQFPPLRNALPELTADYLDGRGPDPFDTDNQ